MRMLLISLCPINLFLKVAMFVASVTVNAFAKKKKEINNQAAAPIKFELMLINLNLFVSLLKKVIESNYSSGTPLEKKNSPFSIPR